MTRTRVKFCGLCRAEDVDAAVALGVDALGLILVPGTPRALRPAQARALRARVPAFVQVVALFQDPGESELLAAVNAVQPDLLQFHGTEPPELCRLAGRPYLKAVPMAAQPDLAQWRARYPDALALVLDGHGAGEHGGQGRTFDWHAAQGGARVVLAGGLRPGNVGAAVRQVRPYAVDVSSGIERAPGVKDRARMAQFIDEVRRADAP